MTTQTDDGDDSNSSTASSTSTETEVAFAPLRAPDSIPRKKATPDAPASQEDRKLAQHKAEKLSPTTADLLGGVDSCEVRTSPEKAVPETIPAPACTEIGIAHLGDAASEIPSPGTATALLETAPATGPTLEYAIRAEEDPHRAEGRFPMPRPAAPVTPPASSTPLIPPVAPALPGAVTVSGIGQASESVDDEDLNLPPLFRAISATLVGENRSRSERAVASPPSAESAAHRELRSMARNAPLVEGHATAGPGDAGDRKVRWGYSSDCFTRRRVWVAIILAALVVAIAAIVPTVSSGTTPATTQDFVSSLRPSEEPSSFSSLHPSEAPSRAPASARFVGIKYIIGNVSAPEDLSKTTSPQFRALVWLSDEDAMRVPEDADASTIIQRYVVATLYFSTGGDEWTAKTLQLSGRHECEWHGIRCSNGSDVDDIDLRRNNLIGTIPTELFALRLRSLNLSANNGIDGTIPIEICDVGDSLESVELSNNRLDGKIPGCIGQQLQNLEFLYLRDNNLSGPIPASINHLQKLQQLELSINSLTGSIVLDFEKLSQLIEVRLWGNLLTGRLPPSITHFNGWLLLMGENRITGTISDGIAGGSSSRLQVLGLWDTELTGTIPASIFAMQQLAGLGLNDNYLSGTIALRDNSLSPALRGIGLERNLLSGTIPSSIGDLSALAAFNAFDNTFTGTLPASMGNMSSLRLLDLGNNELVGSVPGTFSNLTNLDWFHVGNNNLHGSLDFLCDTSIQFMVADCKGIDAKIGCSCCLMCCDDDEKEDCNTHMPSVVLIKECAESGDLSSEQSVDSICDDFGSRRLE